MVLTKSEHFFEFLKNKSLWVRRETLKIHKSAQQTRIASSLSCVEILVVLYYGKILKFNPKNVNSDRRDRFIISKGHGAVSLYPILADFGFFSRQNLSQVCQEGSFLGSIPDPVIPGFETVNGSLGHGLGVACGLALALKRKKREEKVFVLLGDGELYEGSVWEAIMFAAEHKLDNLVAVIDNNKICMLDYCKNIINLAPLSGKFRTFNWDVKVIDGHDLKQLYDGLAGFKASKNNKPKILIADTVKGKGVLSLENDSLSHIKNVKPEEIDSLIGLLK